jgi:hypothetical protein
MASVPPPPDQSTPPAAPVLDPAGPGPSSKTTILAIVASVAVIAILGTVIAIANSGDSSGDASPSASSAPVPLTRPDGLAADAAAFRVVLTWTAGEGSPAVRYLVSRDGKVAATLDPGETKWVDDDVKPETRYSYSVAALGPDGTSVSAGVVTRSRTAPLATARLDGTFDVHLHATSHYGFSDFGSGNGNLGWQFIPTCAHDPCDATLTDLHMNTFRLRLAQQGSSYHGDASVNARVRCGGSPVVSNITIVVRITDAGIVDGDWVATKIEGTMRQSESAQLGCVASGATYDLVGKVVVAGHAEG